MSKDKMYNAHVCISGIPAFEEMIKRQLNFFAKAMPLNEKNEATFWNEHMDGYEDSCPGIIMIGKGDICPLFPRCSLNPLYKNKKGKISLSTWSTGGCFSKTHSDWGKSIAQFNAELSDFSGSMAILGYIIFAEDKNPDYIEEA